MAAEEKKEKKGRSGLSALLGMVLSGLLSIFIASTMFMVGVVHNKMEDDRARRALIHFLAVEAGDIHAEACKSAYGLFVGNRHREMAALQMGGARSLDKALALDADPKLVATLRSIYGRLNRLTRDLKSAGAFYRERKKLTQSQIGRAIDECSGMGKDLEAVLEIAADEGVDASALAELKRARAEAAKLTDALVKKKETLLADVQFNRTSFDLGTWRTGVIPVLTISNFSPGPVTITGLTYSGGGARPQFVTVVGGRKRPLGTQTPEIKPDETVKLYPGFPHPKDMPRGPLKEEFIVETDCPGYERLTLPVTGVVKRLYFDKVNSYKGSFNVRRGKTGAFIQICSYSDRAATVRSATSSIAGVELTMPKGNRLEPCQKIRICPNFEKASLPAGPFEGTFTIETDFPGYESVKIPVKGTVSEQ